MKLRSHWPSVTPSVGVLVGLPLHVTLIVEAALASAIGTNESKKMQRYVRFDIRDLLIIGRYEFT
jgi:hypothetical protein